MKFKSLFVILTILVFLFLCKTGITKVCPEVKELQKRIEKSNVKILKILKSPVPGLCEVIVELPNDKKSVFYTDYKGDFIIIGKILDLKHKKDITKERIVFLNKRYLNASQLAELEKLVVFQYGNSPNIIYLITDPKCPFCRKAERILDKLVKEGKIAVKVVLFPLEKIHPGATNMAVSIICDNKGFSELINGYNNKNLCKSGKQKVKKSVDQMLKWKIYAVPTYVFSDGEIRMGVLNEEELVEKIAKLNNTK